MLPNWIWLIFLPLVKIKCTSLQNSHKEMMPFLSGSLYYFDINSKFDVHSKLNKIPQEIRLIPIFTKKLYR